MTLLYTARGLALEVLDECHGGTAFVQETLHKHLSRATLSSADRRLATQLAYGVLRRRATLDALLQRTCQRPRQRVHPAVWQALRLGAFQLALLTNIPVHAALYETVELAGTAVAPAVRPRVKGFVNGVLRALSRLLTHDFAPGPAADALPLSHGRYRRLRRPVLPDPAVHPVEYVAAAFALPAWLVERWLARFGWQEGLRLAVWFASPAPLWLRCNTLRTDRAAFLEALRQAGIAAEAGGHPQAVRLAEHAAIRELPGYEQGWFAVQDESAMRVAPALAPQPGDQVLDLCAAPGGKTTHLAELMGNQGRILACDADEDRLRVVTELASRLRSRIVETCCLRDRLGADAPAGPFDAVLADVPCSNTGVLGRRPEVRWRIKPQHLRHLVELQRGLLLQAADRLKPGGAVVYSTCSIEPEENGAVVRAVLQERPDLVLEAEEEQVPGRPADGGYWARLRRHAR